MFKTIGIAGLGLMGGSFAKALALLPAELRPKRILALDTNAKILEKAQDSGEIDEGFTPENAANMLSQCDFVILCLYPKASIEFLRKRRADFKCNSIVTDISGVKSALMRALPSILRDDVDFICGHPMAGSEKEGFSYADASIFKGRNYILMPLPSNKPENLTFFKELVLKLGFARITEATFHAHDHKVAFTSQLCHVIASALVDSAEDTEITAFGGGSYEDLTRIAMINAPLWTELFLANKSELIAHIDAFEVSLDKIKSYIQTEDSRSLKAALQSVREKRIAMVS
ncbi:MAG: prephenate dehydrogenase [Spirochaetaceae bacterium]|jgi:prephenate dehydrogenase|nr:prephenate dehydrogenase [Spirochaetaceae bacterium]GMO19152.1 MAG: prephenate dehydrogenase [Termitinemataceae bacterium]